MCTHCAHTAKQSNLAECGVCAREITDACCKHRIHSLNCLSNLGLGEEEEENDVLCEDDHEHSEKDDCDEDEEDEEDGA